MTKEAKAAFVKRMAAGRKAAAQKKPAAKKKATGKKKRAVRPAKKSAAKKNPAPKKKRISHQHRPAVKAARKQRKARRRNPDMSAAEAKYAEFHGRPSTRTIEYDQVYRYPAEYAEMGKLKELRFELDPANPDFPLTNFGACQAVCTPDGANIYFIGGDQAIDFETLDIASDKDFVELGACTYIRYHTVKGFHDFEPIDYEHEFGEEDGLLPILAYDRLNKSLFLISGNYRVRPAGIEN